MKILIMVDMEGISGITSSDQVNADSGRFYAEGRQYVTWETNACIDGCFAGGADEVIVRDAHMYGKNLLWEQLDPRAQYVVGQTGDIRLPDIESCDGVILLGYHAMAGTPGAVLEHTMSSAGWQKLKVNGTAFGEIGIDAAYAGEYGVPVILVSGDDKCCAEARSLIPGVLTAQVKEAYSLCGARLLSREAAHALIRRKSAEAAGHCLGQRPFSVAHPVTITLEVTERSPLPSLRNRPYLRCIDGHTIEVTADSFVDAFWKILL